MKTTIKAIWAVAALVLMATATSHSFMRTPLSNKARRYPNAAPAAALQYHLCPTETVVFPFDVFLPPAPLQADILFAFDTTGSMHDVIETTQDRALDIMSNLQSVISDVRFGVIDFRDYAYFPYGRADDWPYRLRQRLTQRPQTVQARIAQLEADGGADQPESYTRALYESYADQHIGWRSEARRFIVMFGDSYAHDDDLNAGVPPPQPYLPNETWQTGSYPPPHRDPGRDAVEGTGDDLDFQPVLTNLRDQAITLLFIVSASDNVAIEGPSDEDLLIYWQIWAGMTGPGGDARALDNLDALPETIQALITAAVRHVDRLAVVVAPSWFDEWVMTTPPGYFDLDIPAEGLYRGFETTLTVPPTIQAGQYTLNLIAEADGTVYDRRRIEITVDNACFATPTLAPTPTATWVFPPPPKPRHTDYLPFIAKDLINLQP